MKIQEDKDDIETKKTIKVSHDYEEDVECLTDKMEAKKMTKKNEEKGNERGDERKQGTYARKRDDRKREKTNLFRRKCIQCKI